MIKSRVQQKCPKCSHTFLPSVKEIQSRAGKASRRKGANFENKLAKELQKWWNDDKYTYEFKRTPMSGGSALKEGFDMAGDLCSSAPDFKFHIEAKNAPSQFPGLHSLFSDKATVWKWLDQAEGDCPEHKTPILIINRFDQPTWCIACGEDFIKTVEECKLSHLTFVGHCRLDMAVWEYKAMLDTNPDMWRKPDDKL